jgi:hypothetical protein
VAEESSACAPSASGTSRGTPRDKDDRQGSRSARKEHKSPCPARGGASGGMGCADGTEPGAPLARSAPADAESRLSRAQGRNLSPGRGGGERAAARLRTLSCPALCHHEREGHSLPVFTPTRRCRDDGMSPSWLARSSRVPQPKCLPAAHVVVTCAHEPVPRGTRGALT